MQVRLCLIGVTTLAFIGSTIGRADIVVNEALPASCPSTCTIGSMGQPDLAVSGTPTTAQEFLLSSLADITSINFWTYQVPGAPNVGVQWAVVDSSNQTLGSGTIASPVWGTPVLVNNLADTQINLDVEEVTLNLPTALILTPSPSPEQYTLELLVMGDQSSYYWGEAADQQHYAFQLIGTDTPTVPEPSFFWFTAGGLGMLTALRFRKKR